MHVRKSVKKLLTKGETVEMMEHVSKISPKVKTRILKFCSGSFSMEKIDKIKSKLSAFGLKDFEIINLIDIKPTGLVHLQTIIEEMAERFDDEHMEGILNVFLE